MRGPNGSGLYYWKILLQRNDHLMDEVPIIAYGNHNCGYEYFEDMYHEILWTHFISRKTYRIVYNEDGNLRTPSRHNGVFKIWKDGCPPVFLDQSLRLDWQMSRTLECSDAELATGFAMRLKLLSRFSNDFFFTVVNTYVPNNII